MPYTNDVEDSILKKNTTNEVMIVLFTLNAFELAMLKADGNPKVKKLLDSPELQPFWVNKFNKLHLENDHSFQFRDPSPQSKADFYCGYVLYLAAIKEKHHKQSSSYKDYLHRSLSTFNSFHATQEIIFSLIASSENNQEKISALSKFIINQSSQIEQFKTPGCLLLANAYFYLAGFYQSLNLKKESIECYKACWKQLHLAQLLEKYSERDIHNAYFDKGLVASNAFGLNSIAEIKNHFLEFSSAALPYPVRHALEMNAEESFRRKYGTEDQSVSLDDLDTQLNIGHTNSFR